MLGLLGLMGLVMGGLMMDSLLSASSEAEDDADKDTPEALTGSAEDHGSMLDWIDPPVDHGGEEGSGGEEDDDTLPDSDDLPEEENEGVLLSGKDADETLQGHGGEDTILGEGGIDQILGRGGDDWIDAGDGNDHITAGEGDDTLIGGAGNDALHGDAGQDALSGGDGDDALAGHSGNDSLDGGAGNDELLGGEGDDLLTDDQGDDWLAGGAGNDVIAGGTGSDTLDGGTGDDTLIGHHADKPDSSVDYLNAGNGDDTLLLGENDVATGDDGHDSFVLGDWLSGGGFAHIQDYNPEEDQIVLVYDANSHPDPNLLLVRDSESDDVTVFFDGVPLAMVQNGAGLTPADIRLDATGSAYPAAFHTAGAAA
jgi:Ca2+-binding RTX toxin-like protein